MTMYIIMSAERPARTPAQDRDNAFRTNCLHRTLFDRGIDFTPARGSYKGDQERCVVIALEGATQGDAEFVRHLAFSVFQQESILVVGGDSMCATLVYSGETSEPLGVMTKVAMEDALRCDAWTRVRNASGFDYWVALDSPLNTQ
jgi:hypothetical protein